MKLNIVIPCYNEEEVLSQTFVRMKALLARLKAETDTDARLLFVDDGSRDRTWELIAQAAQNDETVCGLKLSHNKGHQNALWAGMEQGVDTCDAMVSIDADLQDDENAIVDMARQVNEGKDIVYGVRKERRTDTWFKRFSAEAFYKLMKRVDDEIIFNHADFRMMTNRAVKALIAYPERKAREAGDSKYPLKKMISFSIDGITSFSVAPLRFITCVGLLMTFMAFVFIIYALVRNAEGETIQGWTSLLVSLWFIGGIVTTSIGITGLYVGKIYIEVKRRPRYFIEQRLNL